MSCLAGRDGAGRTLTFVHKKIWCLELVLIGVAPCWLFSLKFFVKGMKGKTYKITPNPDSACYVVVFGNEFDGAVLGVDFFLH